MNHNIFVNDRHTGVPTNSSMVSSSTIPSSITERTSDEKLSRPHASNKGWTRGKFIERVQRHALLITNILLSGLAFSSSSAATFGFIFPSTEVLVTDILGKGSLSKFLEGDVVSQFVWIIAGACAGFMLGFTHIVVGTSCSKYVTQFIGRIEFKNERREGDNFFQKAANFFVDVGTFDVVVICSFGLSRSLATATFSGLKVSSVLPQFMTSSIGGLLAGMVSFILKTIFNSSFSKTYHPRVSYEERQTFFAIFEKRMGDMIREEDLLKWVREFGGRVIGGSISRPIAIVVKAFTWKALDRNGFSNRTKDTTSAVIATVSFLILWFISIRLSVIILRQVLPRLTKKEASLTEKERDDGSSEGSVDRV